MNIRNMDIVNCFPLLASVLGDKYGVKVRIGGQEAKTDGNVIWLPAMPPEPDAQVVQAARGFLDHEAAHIRYTDFAILRREKLDKLENWLFNALEDWRVERKLVEIFPGCTDNFRQLIIRIFGETRETGCKNPVSLVLNYVLLTVRSWTVPEIAPRQLELGQTLLTSFPELKSRLDAILKVVPASCGSTSEAVSHARAMADLIRKYCLDAQDSASPGSRLDNKTEEKSGSISNTAHSENQEAQESTVKGPKTLEPDQNKEQGEHEESGMRQDIDPDNDEKSTLDDSWQTCDMDLPQNLGELLCGELELQKPYETGDAVTIAAIGKKETRPFTPEAKAEALRNSTAMRQRLSGLLLTQAMQPEALGRKGRLDSGCLHRVCVGNAKVFRKCSEKTGLDTALHILLDCSSSMSGTAMEKALKSCYALVSALSGIRGINLALTAFSAEDGKETVYPVLRHAQKASAMPALDAFGETPLGPALWWVMQQMLPLQESRKIVLIITDGVPTSVKAAMIAIGQCGKLGLELVGLGIQSTALDYLLPKGGKTIWRLEELAPAMFELMGQTLPRGGA